MKRRLGLFICLFLLRQDLALYVHLDSSEPSRHHDQLAEVPLVT